MSIIYSVIFLLLIISLAVCTIAAKKSPRVIGGSVAFLNCALIPPVLGNLLLLVSNDVMISAVGCYLYFIGMDLVLFSLINFSVKYCESADIMKKVSKGAYVLLAVDSLQIFLNLITGHAFSMDETYIEGVLRYSFVPHAGLVFHRVVDYGILVAIVIIYIIMIFRMPRIYRERYSVILYSILLGGAWMMLNIIDRSQINTSMIGLALSGIVIYHFAVRYKPMRLLDRMLSNIVSEMPEAMFVFDPTHKCIWANEQGCRMAGCTENELEKAVGVLVEMFGDPKRHSDSKVLERKVGSGKDMRHYTLEEDITTDEKGKVTGSYLSIRDVTEEKIKIEREMYFANHDRLTGLYTKEHFFDGINEVLNSKTKEEYYIVFVDVHNFKLVNDILGVTFGDYALKMIADWIRRNMTERCRYGRLEGDTFGMLIPVSDFDAARIEDELTHFIVKNGKASYQLLIHLGVYKVDSSTDRDISVMFDRAHLAITSIQDEYNTHIAYYNKELREKVLWDQSISGQLEDAIKRRDIRPYLQPIADVNGDIIGAEALARWIHPERGFLSPISFIPVFEKNGMIIEVDRYMWRCACEILSDWQKKGLDIFISVNISPKDFYFMDVVSEICSLADEYAIDRDKLRIEITETVMMTEGEDRVKILDSMRANGFLVEMDDFGSGYSSLNMLKDIPVDVLKIDMKFLDSTGDREKGRMIVKNIISLSEELGISSLTEGVETEEQYRLLSRMGCRMFQGYYFAKPMPVDDITKLIMDGQNKE